MRKLRSAFIGLLVSASFCAVSCVRRGGARSEPASGEVASAVGATALALPGGSVDVATYQATPDVLSAFVRESGGRYEGAWKETYDLRFRGQLPPELAPLAREEIIAIQQYTTSDYRSINTALRANTPQALAPFENFVRAIVSGLNKLPRHVGLVYRGTHLRPEWMANYEKGNVVVERTFLSTSLEAAVAEEFMENAFFTITSKTGRSIGSLSANPDEREVLFQAGTRFLVQESVESQGVRRISMMEQ